LVVKRKPKAEVRKMVLYAYSISKGLEEEAVEGFNNVAQVFGSGTGVNLGR
jgi:hypothetical protein